MIEWLLHGTLAVGGGTLAVREVVGNAFGLASAVLGMRRLVWAWPVGLVGPVVGTGTVGSFSALIGSLPRRGPRPRLL